MPSDAMRAVAAIDAIEETLSKLSIQDRGSVIAIISARYIKALENTGLVTEYLEMEDFMRNQQRPLKGDEDAQS